MKALKIIVAAATMAAAPAMADTYKGTFINGTTNVGTVTLTLNGNGTVAGLLTSANPILGFAIDTGSIINQGGYSSSAAAVSGWQSNYGMFATGFQCFAPGPDCGSSLTWTIGNAGQFTSVAQLFTGAGSSSDFLFYSSGGIVYANAVAATLPVPESATWAMMIAGFGLVGFALRRQTARVALA